MYQGSWPLFLAVLASTALNAQPGELDPTFGNDGVVTGPQWGSHAVDLQTDQRILVLTGTGWIAVDSSEVPPLEYLEGTPWLQRFNTVGALDLSFGDQGTVDLVAMLSWGPTAMTVLPDDRIVLAGTVWWAPDISTIALARLTPDGVVDVTFGNGGTFVLDPGTAQHFQCNGVLNDGFGRLLVYGDIRYTSNNNNLLVARFNADGALDTTFGTNGIVAHDVGGNPAIGVDVVHGAALLPDGSLAITGRCAVDLPKLFFIARLDPDGSFDAAFGTNGFQIDAPLGPPWSWTVGRHIGALPNGGWLVTGDRYTPGVDVFSRRYLADGTLDPSFGGSGEIFDPLPEDYAQSDLQAVWPLPDGGLLFVTNSDQIALGHFGPDGIMVPDFSQNGLLEVTDQAWAEPSDLVVQNDGRIVVVGTAHDDDGLPHFLMFRANAASITGIASPHFAEQVGLYVHGNPIGPMSALELRLAQGGPVSVNVFDALGRRVSIPLPERQLPAGTHRIAWPHSDELPAGTYHVQVITMTDRTSVGVCVIR